MKSFHINFVNLSTPQFLTQKLRGYLYEKLHLNFNIPSIFKWYFVTKIVLVDCQKKLF